MSTIQWPQVKQIDRSFWPIFLLVVTGHILAILFSEFYAGGAPQVKPPKKQALIVQTVSLTPPSPAIKNTTQTKTTQIAQASLPDKPASAKKTSETVKPVEKKEEKKEQRSVSDTKKPSTAEPAKKVEKKEAVPKKEVTTKKAESKPKEKSKQPVAKQTASKSKVESKKEPAKANATKASTEAKAEAKKMEVSKPDPRVEAANAKRRELLASASATIGKVEKGVVHAGAVSGGNLAAAPGPGRIESLAVETFPEEVGEQLNAREVTYYDELASRLKMLLRLPEYGEVKIKLTLDRAGVFKKVAIVSAESPANKKYLEKTLPTLKYPSFGSNFSDRADYTFVISLSNDL